MKAISMRKTLLALTAVAVILSSAAYASGEASGETAGGDVNITDAAGGVFKGSELFTDRDLRQEADLTGAVSYTVSDGAEIRITAEGVYVLSGTAKNATVYVEAGDEDKVQLVLNGLSVTNDDFPCIYVLSAGKVFLNVSGDSSLSVTGRFRSDGTTNTDSVIFSRSDLVLNGTAVLTIASSANGVSSKDDLKFTGGTYVIDADEKCIEANDSIRIAAGVFTLTAGGDALHAEHKDDDSDGYIFIGGGELNITAEDEGIHAVTVAQIDNGTVSITAADGIKATYVQLNGGTIDISADDDGVSGTAKSTAYSSTVEITGGSLTVVMSSGKAEGISSGGALTITGGSIDVTGSSKFDIDGTVTFTGGTVIINGEQVDTIPTGGGGLFNWG